MSFYVIIYILLIVWSLVYIGRHIYRMVYKSDSSGSSPENIYTWNLAGINLYRIYAMIKDVTSCKTTIFLIEMAKRGYIKIRDTGKEMYIDKVSDADNLEQAPRTLMHALFDDKSSTYSDEGSVMPVTTVLWKEVSGKYRSVIGRIIKENKKPKTKPRKLKLETEDRDSWFNTLGIPVFVMWVIMGLAFATSQKVANPSTILIDNLVTFTLMTCFFITIPLISLSLGMKLFEKMSQIYVDIGRAKETADKIVLGLVLVVFILVFLVCFGCGVGALLLYWLISIVEAAGTPMVFFNLILYLTGILASIAYVYIRMRGVSLKKEKTIADVVNLAITAQDIKKTALSVEDMDSLYLLAYMLERHDIISALDMKKKDTIEWYIGENYDGIEGVLKELDKN